MIKLLFICYGNICRSPMSEFVMKDMALKEGYSVRGLVGAREDADFDIASAATSREEIGNPIYPPARKKLAEHGIGTSDNELGVAQKTARQMTLTDYDYYDVIICMDRLTLDRAKRIANGDPENKITMLLDYTDRAGDEVADPWYTGDFDATWDDVISGCKGIIKHINESEGI